MDSNDVKTLVDEFSKWDKLQADCKQQIELLKGEFQKLGLKEMESRKVKQVEYWGTGGAKVVVTTSETVKVISHTYLMNTLGDVLKDFEREKTTYEYSEPFKRILASIFQGNYIEQTLDDVITQVTDDEKTRKALKKKLKGNWAKDVETLKTLTGCNQETAEHFAYFAQEAANYERIVQLMEVSGKPNGTDAFNEGIKSVRNAVIVEEGVTIGIEAEDVA